jgi:hypothetical protein
MSFTPDNPYTFIDAAKDKYSLYLFTGHYSDRSYISIEVIFNDPKTTVGIFGHSVRGNIFALPFDGKIIDWRYLDPINIMSVVRVNKYVSPEAQNMINRIIKLKAFI